MGVRSVFSYLEESSLGLNKKSIHAIRMAFMQNSVSSDLSASRTNSEQRRCSKFVFMRIGSSQKRFVIQVGWN